MTLLKTIRAGLASMAAAVLLMGGVPIVTTDLGVEVGATAAAQTIVPTVPDWQLYPQIREQSPLYGSSTIGGNSTAVVGARSSTGNQYGVDVTVVPHTEVTIKTKVVNTTQAPITDVTVNMMSPNITNVTCFSAGYPGGIKDGKISLAPGEYMTCTGTYNTAREAGWTETFTPTISGINQDGTTYRDSTNSVTVIFSGTEPASSSQLSITTKVNGELSTTEPGPEIATRSVPLSFEVTNTGDKLLRSVFVRLDTYPSMTGRLMNVSCPAYQLSPGESMTCTTTTSVDNGINHTAVGIVTGRPDGEFQDVGSTSVAYFRGPVSSPAIDIVKKINGDDANTAPGVTVDPGAPMQITIDVKNSGDIPLYDIVVTDTFVDSSQIACSPPLSTSSSGDLSTSKQATAPSNAIATLRPGQTATCKVTIPAPKVKCPGFCS